MKVIGLIGGMTWLSTAEYYRYINEEVGKRLGGFHSALLALYSVDMHEIEKIHREGRWDDAGEILGGAAKALERAGADFLVLCTNTMHKVADAIEKSSRLKLLHIADVTGEAIVNWGLKTVGLLGTRFTMGEQFYRERLENRFGLGVLVPEEKDRETVHRIIAEELAFNKIRASSRETYVEIVGRLIEKGAEGVILGCTEIPLLIGSKDVNIPVFDTTALHAIAAVNMALS
jgi:aspartate racemase